MIKLIITENQYKSILLFENSDDILLGLAKVMDIKLTGQNENIANNAVKSKSTMGAIKNALEDSEKIKEFIESLTNKGMDDASNKLLYKTDIIADNFNRYSKENNLGYSLDMLDIANKILKDK